MASVPTWGVHARPMHAFTALCPRSVHLSCQPLNCTCTSSHMHLPRQQRRTLMMGVAGTAFLLPGLSWAQIATTPTQLPKDYVQLVRKLLTALKEAVEVDLSPASEAEVRRKADPAKGLVKEWVSSWRDVRSVSSDPSYRQMTESLQLLGEFYLKKGQRARLPKELGASILERLAAASDALPAEAKA